MSEEIKAIRSRIVYQNKWMTLREDEIVRPSGATGRYSVVEKPDFAVIAAIENGRMYLVEQYRYPVGGRYWEMPQGSWEQQTIDPLELAKAELREETGLVAGSMRHVGRLFLAYGYSRQAYDVFLATELEQWETQLDLEEEGLVAKAFDVAVVEQMILDGVIQDASTVAAFGLLRLKKLI